MATSNDINVTVIDETYPVAGQDNDSQGFRDNFQNIKNALTNAKDAIGTLESNAPSTIADNDFNDNTISKAILEDTAWSAPSAETIAGETNVDYTSGHYRRLILTSATPATNTVVVTNWAPANSMGHMILEVRSNDTNSKNLNFSTPTGNIKTDTSNLDLSSDFSVSGYASGSTEYKYLFEVWSPDQGANIFINYLGRYENS